MEKIIVSVNSPIRLDRYLRRYYNDITQGVIERMLRQGKIKLNDSKAKSSTRVKDNDVIIIKSQYFVQEENNNKQFSMNVIKLSEKLLADYLLFNCDEFIAIDKPEGLAVQGGSKISLSVDSALEYINYSQKTQFKLVHRLDKDTSGILLIANGYDNARILTTAFKEQLIEKIYIAVLSQIPDKLEGKLENYIGKDVNSNFQIVKELEDGGKVAQTNYKILKSSKNLALVEYRPQTGRMHQLRFHSKFLSCPIVGDKKYGGINFHRMLLHAHKISLPSALFGKNIAIESKLPEEFQL